jgi:hypothetical protein
VCRPPYGAFDTLDVLHEHVLDQPVRLFDVGVVVALANVSDFLERPASHHFPGLAKRLEGVLALARHHDIADEAEVIALARGIGEIADHAGRTLSHRFREA